jgi:hypothetical protein
MNGTERNVSEADGGETERRQRGEGEERQERQVPNRNF